MNHRWLFTTLIVIILLLAIADPGLPWRLQQRLSGSGALASQNAQLQALQLQNESLRTQVAQLQDMQQQLPAWSPRAIAAPIFATYPFDLKNQLLVGVGSKEGAAAAQPALLFAREGSSTAPDAAGNELLIGKTDKVYDDSSVVQTIFDSQWRSLVRIGAGGVEGLLLGGAQPRITLISKDATVLAGDAVYNADPRFPYALPIASIGEVHLTPDHTSQEATLSFNYSLADFNNLLLITNYNVPPAANNQ